VDARCAICNASCRRTCQTGLIQLEVTESDAPIMSRFDCADRAGRGHESRHGSAGADANSPSAVARAHVPGVSLFRLHERPSRVLVGRSHGYSQERYAVGDDFSRRNPRAGCQRCRHQCGAVADGPLHGSLGIVGCSRKSIESERCLYRSHNHLLDALTAQKNPSFARKEGSSSNHSIVLGEIIPRSDSSRRILH
jgi:hypothetical protein